MEGSKNSVRYTPVSSNTMKLYIAISPSRNDQCVGNTLFSWRRTAAEGWYRESTALPWPAKISPTLGGLSFGLMMLCAPKMPALWVRGNHRSLLDTHRNQ